MTAFDSNDEGQDTFDDFAVDEDEEWPNRPDPKEVVEMGMMDGSPSPLEGDDE